MAKFIKEQMMVDNNAFRFEEKLSSQYTRFLETPPVFVVYYSVDTILSTADEGFAASEQILGGKSSIRYNKIENLPVYDLDSIIADLDMEEEGLDISFDSELTILPNTVQPKPYDFFVLTHLQEPVLFLVTSVRYDSVRSNGFYKISYKLKSITETSIEQLESQTVDNFQCVVDNIGTDSKCIIRNEDYTKLNKVKSLIDELTHKYKTLYYNEKYNSFVFRDVSSGILIYDKFLANFIMKTKVFSDPRHYKTLYLNNEDDTDLFPIEYERSFYRIVEKRKVNLVPSDIRYLPCTITNADSIFRFYRVTNAYGIHFIHGGGNEYIPCELLSFIRNNMTTYKTVDGDGNDTSKCIDYMYSVLVKYFNNDDNLLYIYEVDRMSVDDIDYSIYHYSLIPILVYVLQQAILNFNKKHL